MKFKTKNIYLKLNIFGGKEIFIYLFQWKQDCLKLINSGTFWHFMIWAKLSELRCFCQYSMHTLFAWKNYKAVRLYHESWRQPGWGLGSKRILINDSTSNITTLIRINQSQGLEFQWTDRDPAILILRPTFISYRVGQKHQH